MEEETTETELQTVDVKQSDKSTTDNDAGTTTSLKKEEKKEEEKDSKTENLRIGSVSSAGSNNANLEEEEEESQWNKIRKFVRLEIIQTPWFETVILIVIILNCVFLALENPTNQDETLEQYDRFHPYMRLCALIFIYTEWWILPNMYSQPFISLK